MLAVQRHVPILRRAFSWQLLTKAVIGGFWFLAWQLPRFWRPPELFLKHDCFWDKSLYSQDISSRRMVNSQMNGRAVCNHLVFFDDFCLRVSFGISKHYGELGGLPSNCYLKRIQPVSRTLLVVRFVARPEEASGRTKWRPTTSKAGKREAAPSRRADEQQRSLRRPETHSTGAPRARFRLRWP